jgi:CMD domain protein
MTTHPVPDAVDTILSIRPGSFLDELRSRRAVTRAESQASYLALFQPRDASQVSLVERSAVALFVALLHSHDGAAAFYHGHLQTAGDDGTLAAGVQAAAKSGATTGPYGTYREEGLRGEDRAGLRFTVPAALRSVLGGRLAAALEHAHLLVFRLRESSPDALAVLLNAGWSTTGIVTLSQLVAFLSYQLRVVVGLEALAANRATDIYVEAATTSGAHA